jgi:hypothetical protein
VFAVPYLDGARRTRGCVGNSKRTTRADPFNLSRSARRDYRHERQPTPDGQSSNVGELLLSGSTQSTLRKLSRSSSSFGLRTTPKRFS